MTLHDPVEVHLLGEFALVHAGVTVPTGAAARRVLAYLAVRGRPVARGLLSGTLWGDVPGPRASSNLRAALARLPRPAGVPLVAGRAGQLGLATHVTVDLDDARRCLRPASTGLPAPEPDAARFVDDLLPDWADDWLLLEQERFRQQRLHRLEEVSADLCARGRFGEALNAALAAVAGEPLRESPHRRVIQVHLAEDNPAEALRQYESYRRLVRSELGLAPSAAMRALVGHLLGRPADG